MQIKPPLFLTNVSLTNSMFSHSRDTVLSAGHLFTPSPLLSPEWQSPEAGRLRRQFSLGPYLVFVICATCLLY